MRLFFAALPLLLPAPSGAQGLSPSETTALPRVIDHLCHNIHDLNGCENIFLLENIEEPDTADLIVLPDRRTDAEDPLLILRSVAFNGAMWGMSPSLEAAGEGFTLHSEQTGIGRHPWHESLTVRWIDDAFYVTAYAFSTYDRILAASANCNLDILGGYASTELSLVDMETEADEVTGRSWSVEMELIPITDWRAFMGTPEPCAVIMDAFYEASL